MPKTYKIKVCATCGKAEGKHWARHWKLRHPSEVINELIPGEAPSHPYDENWVYLIKDPKVKTLFKNDFTQYRMQETLSEALAQTTEQANQVINKRVDCHVLSQTEIIESTIQEAAKLFDKKVGYHFQNIQTIEIDVESDTVLQNEEEKHDEAIQFEDEDDYSSIPTKILFKKAQLILNIIQERLIAKDASLRDQLTKALQDPKVTQEFNVRPAYFSHGGNHLSMGRVLEGNYVDSSLRRQVIATFQFTMRDKIDSRAQYSIDYLYGEIKRVGSNISEITSISDSLVSISLPVELTINECNAKIQVVEQSLSLRSRQLLKRPRQPKKTKTETEDQHIQYVSRPDRAIYCPMLYAPCNSSDEDESPEGGEPTGPREIKTSDIGDSGEDLTEGILTIDGSRYLLSKVRQEVKTIKFLDLRDTLLTLIDSWRAFLNRKLQYFVNMVLLSWVDFSNEKVRLVFDGYWLEPREFTVNVKAKERRGAKKSSHYYLRTLQEVVKDIRETLFEVKDFANAFSQLKFNLEDYDLLLPLVKNVVDAARTLKQDNEIEHIHRLHQFQVVLRESITQLNDPEIMTNLKETQQEMKFWATADLKSIVKWRIMKKTAKEQMKQ